MITLIIFTVIVAMAVFATIVHVWDAQSLVDEELRRLAAEQEAFTDFAKRVAAIEKAEPTVSEPSTGGLVTAKNGPGDRLDRVKTAYLETVMAVDHFEEDYGESLKENLSAEFGDDLAVAVSDGRQFTPQLKAALVQASRKAAQDRASFRSILEDEADALADSASTQKEINAERKTVAESPPPSRSYEDLVDDWHHLGRLADRCDQLASERQRQLRELSSTIPYIDTEINEYLYAELPVSHPVLADAASLAQAIKELRSQLIQSVAHRI